VAARCNAPGLERVARCAPIWRRAGGLAASTGWGRSLKHLIELMAELEAERIGFQRRHRIHRYDHTRAASLVFHIFGALAGVLSVNLTRETDVRGGWQAARSTRQEKAAGEKKAW